MYHDLTDVHIFDMFSSIEVVILIATQIGPPLASGSLFRLVLGPLTWPQGLNFQHDRMWCGRELSVYSHGVLLPGHSVFLALYPAGNRGAEG